MTRRATMTEAAGPDVLGPSRLIVPDSGLSGPALAALLVAVDPFGLGGIVVRARASPLRDRWLAQWRALLGEGTPLRRLPLHAGDARLFGGLDLTATLAAGRPIAERGILAETDGGLLLLAMAERIPAAMAARLGAVLDSGTVLLERDGFTQSFPARVGMVALDEGIGEEEGTPPALCERLSCWIDLDGFDPSQNFGDFGPALAQARRLYPAVSADDAMLGILSETAAALGVVSLRTGVLALRAARAAAALGGRRRVEHQDAALAARLVLSPRATRLPADPQAEAEATPAPDTSSDAASDAQTDADRTEPDPGAETQNNWQHGKLEDIVLAAARAAIPPGLLMQLQAATPKGPGRQTPGRAGAPQTGTARGRPAGIRRGRPVGGARLNVIETLRAAAPWQKLRRQAPTAQPPRAQAPDAADRGIGAARRLEIRADDLRLTRLKQRTEITTIFVVDASGSLAINRLAEAKGAVELLLADCYVRRDQVALLAFRGRGAELLLPPTRSLARAKRCLAELPGGGGTPLATAIDAAMRLADQIRRRGQTPVVVFLTDGRANVARDGTTGRPGAEADSQLAARAAAATGVRMLLVDAAQRPQPAAAALATLLGARYLPLRRAETANLSAAIRIAATS